ncbi:hypothetical protein, variant [Aphanomyces astaci]|uniref:Uncharacterized protein n=1 Tax=Aphanomyces astaci TaxID=112090 RepID=W4FRW5_APHAT|nr:hypothetical protein, variant [Aphanomyces astaci]ETV70217.1 hypothetical protein, variant [Aphanomyces astaci]|eukprot:XP_009840312.1 hypothetical protein, variant [Aphanomyces astaci]
MHESPADATWGYYDLHSTPTASPYMSARRHSRHESPSSSFKQHTRGSLCSPLPPPLRTIRRVTCLHQLGGRSPNESLTNLDTSSGSGAPTSSTMMMVPPLPKHSPTIHKWISLPPPPPPPPPPTIHQYTPQVESSVYMRHRPPSAMDGSPTPLLLMAKIGILRQSHRTVVVSLQHQHLTWHAVDASFRPVHGCVKHDLVLTPGTTSVQAAKKHWAITTSK